MFFKKAKLERQLMEEIKQYAHVDEFPYEDAITLSKIVNAYNQGNAMISMTVNAYGSTIEKYPELYRNWDNVFKKYKKLGLFPNWNVLFYDDEIDDFDSSDNSNVKTLEDDITGEKTYFDADSQVYNNGEFLKDFIPDNNEVDEDYCAEAKYQPSEEIVLENDLMQKAEKLDEITMPVKELKILKELYDDGIITDKEFSEKKRILLGLN